MVIPEPLPPAVQGDREEIDPQQSLDELLSVEVVTAGPVVLGADGFTQVRAELIEDRGLQ